MSKWRIQSVQKIYWSEQMKSVDFKKIIIDVFM